MTPSADSAFSALRTRRQWLVFLGIAVAAIVAAHLLDRVVWQDLRALRVNDRDWGRLLRSMGYLPTWIVIAGAIWLHDRADAMVSASGGEPTAHWGWRGGLVVLAPTISGAIAEVLKMLIRRQRPVPDVFGYQWRPFSDDPFSSRALGMPSSHVMVAFAGATVLARLFPRAWWLWYLLAGGCALTRVLAVGHFFSDVVVAAILGYAVGVVMARSGGFGRALSGKHRLHDGL